MTELEVKLSADIKDLRSKLSQAEKSVNNFGTKVDKQAAKAGKGFKTVDNASGQANTSLLEFNRVIQDAPFGIQGVGNNITQLAGNFGNLVKTTGGAKAALKAVGSAFLGPGGVIFAISAAVSLLTVYGDKLFKVGGITKELTDATKEFSSSAISEVSTLKALIGIIEDETQSREKRNDAVTILQKKYPQYLKNLSTENSTTDEIRKSVDRLTKSIENRAKVQGAQNLITKKAEELFLQQTQAQEKYQKTIDNLPETLQRAQQANKAYARGVGAASSQIFDVQKNEERQRQIANDRLSKDLGEAEKEYEKYVNQLSNILKETPDLLSAFNVNITDSLKKAAENATATPIYSDADLAAIFGLTPDAQTKLSATANKLAETVNKSFEGNAQPVKAYLSNIEQSLVAFNESANQLITTSISGTFSQLGQAIGQSLVEGGNVLNAVGSAILGGIGSFLSKMGGLLIEYGTLAVLKGKLDLAILAGGPVAIGAGLAAIAVGVAISAIGSAFSSAVSGGANSVGGQGSSNSVSGASQSTFSNSGGFGDGTVVFKITGQDLVGVLNRALNKNKGLGGNLSIG